MRNRKMAIFGAVVLLLSLASVHWMSASASNATLKTEAMPNDSANGVMGTECHELGITTTQMSSPSPYKEGETFDPGSEWISNEKAQVAIEEFWKTINQLKIDVAGAHVDLKGKELIFVIGPDVDAKTVIPAVNLLRENLPVDIKRGCRSRAELDNYLEIISNWVTEKKPNAKLSISIDEMQSAVNIETSSLEFSDQVVTDSSLKDFPIVVSINSAVPEPLARCADTSPHYGGARFGGDSSCDAACTAGFKVRRISDGVVGMSTAGHCRVRNPWSGNLYSGYSFYGAFSIWSYGSGDDWGFITSSSFSPNYYTDPCCPSVRTSSGAASPVVGGSLCISGYVTGARCSMIVQDLSYLNYDPDYNRSITNVKATRSDGTIACQGGDSGGPWFSSSTSKVYGVQSFGLT